MSSPKPKDVLLSIFKVSSLAMASQTFRRNYSFLIPHASLTQAFKGYTRIKAAVNGYQDARKRSANIASTSSITWAVKLQWNSATSISEVHTGIVVCESQDLCYPEDAAIKEFLNRPDTRTMLGAESPGEWDLCSSEVGRNFVSHLDKWSHHTQDYVAALLERGIRVLIYAGTYDWQCNWVANKLWVEKLEWTGNEAYKQQTWKSWVVHGNAAGGTKTSGNLTFASVYGAGHMMSVFNFHLLAI
ncbi:Alpha/Beta hydrolase protein [Chiua virens]|nr:Alpha/Beta hydrolase protein [Chiua virens]